MKTETQRQGMGWLCGAALLATVASTATAGETGCWKEDAISPVANPLFFESPAAQRPVGRGFQEEACSRLSNRRSATDATKSLA